AQNVHAVRTGGFHRVSRLVPLLPWRDSRMAAHVLFRPRAPTTALPIHSFLAHGPGGGNGTPGAGHRLPLPAPSSADPRSSRSADVAPLAVRVGDRSDRLLDALSPLPVGLRLG